MDDRPTEDLPFKVLRREWQPVALSKELNQGQVKSFVLLNTEIVIARLTACSTLGLEKMTLRKLRSKPLRSRRCLSQQHLEY